VLLRPVTRDDGDPMVAIWGDPLVAHFMNDFGPRTPEQVRAWCDQRNKDRFPPLATDSANLAMVVGADVVGWIGAGAAAREPGTWDFGYIVHPDHRGHGYAADALGTLARHAVTDLGLHKVWGTCARDNPASARTMINAGLVEVPTRSDEERRFELSGSDA